MKQPSLCWVVVIVAATATVALWGPTTTVWAQQSDAAYVVAGGGTFGTPFVDVIDTQTNTEVTRISLPERNSGFIGVTPDGTMAYVPGDGFITVIDTRTNEISGMVTDVVRPQRVAFSPDGTVAYVTLLNPPALAIIDTFTNTVTDTIPIPNEDRGVIAVGVTPDGAFAYVSTALPQAAGAIRVIDLASREIVATIPMPVCDFGISSDLAITPDGKRVYVPVFGCTNGAAALRRAAAAANMCAGDCSMNGTVTPDEILLGLGIALGVRTLGVCPLFDVDNSGLITVDEILAAVNAAFGVCAPQPPSPNFALVVDTQTNSVVDIVDFGYVAPGAVTASTRPMTEGALLPSGSGIDITPDGRFAYVAGCTDGVCVIDTADNTVSTVVPTGGVGGLTFDVAITPDGTSAYVVGLEGYVAVIDTASNTVVTSLTVPNPQGVGIRPAGPAGTPTPTPTGPTPTRPPTRTRTETPTPTLTPTTPPTPACQPTDLGSALPVAVSGSTATGTNVFVSFCDASGSNSPEQTFLYTAPVTGFYNIDTTGSDFDTILSVRAVSCGGDELACNDDADPVLKIQTSALTLPLSAGEQIAVIVDGFNLAQGTFMLHIDLPATPTPTATPVCAPTDIGSAQPLTFTGSTAFAADQFFGPCGGFGGPEIVLQYTAPVTGSYRIDTGGSAFDTVLYVRDGDCFGVDLACNDDVDASGTRTSAVTVALEAGQRIAIFVDGFEPNANGDFTLHINVQAPAPSPTVVGL